MIGFEFSRETLWTRVERTAQILGFAPSLTVTAFGCCAMATPKMHRKGALAPFDAVRQSTYTSRRGVEQSGSSSGS